MEQLKKKCSVNQTIARLFEVTQAGKKNGKKNENLKGTNFLGQICSSVLWGVGGHNSAPPMGSFPHHTLRHVFLEMKERLFHTLHLTACVCYTGR